MRIGIDCRCLEGEKTGVGVYLSNLIQHVLELANQSCRFICYFDEEVPSFPWLKDSRVEKRVVRIPIRNNFLWSTLRLPFKLMKDNVDVFHAPSYTTPFLKIKNTIVTIHDISYAVNPEWYSYKSDFIRRYYYYKSARNADIILTVSEFSKAEIVKYYRINPDKIRVIYHGINRRFLEDIDINNITTVLNKYNIKGEYILSIGSLHPRRNLGRLIEAFIKLKNENKDFNQLKLVLVGKDEGSSKQLLSLYGTRNDLIITGYIPEKDIIPLYRGAKCFAFLSFYEGFGFPILEAMAGGLPTLISDIQVFKEIFKDNSLFVNPYNVDEIKNNMFRILTDEGLRKDLSNKGKRHASSFMWKTTAKKTLDIYNGFS